MMGKTNCGLITFIAGCVLICVRRLEPVGDVRRLIFLAECLLCFEASPLYYSGYRRPKSAVRPPPIELIISTIFTRATAVFQQLPGDHSSFPPMSALKNVVALTTYVLGPQFHNFFDVWVNMSIERLNKFSANPNQVFKTRLNFDSEDEWQSVKRCNFGAPIPMDVLNADIPVTSSSLAKIYQSFLSDVSWQDNPYLRSPDKLMASGFRGVPYHWEI